MRSIIPFAALLLAACQAEEAPVGDPAPEAETAPADTAAPGNTADTAPYDGIGPDEALRFLGNEPFWAGEVAGGTLTYKTPDDQEGTAIPVERFAGRGGISFSGEVGGAPLEMMVTPLACSDGMSDRTYPFTVTLRLGEETRNGCGWTDARRFEGPEHP